MIMRQYIRSSRFFLILLCSALLTSCAYYPQHGRHVEDQIVGVEHQGSYVPDYGQVLVQRTGSGRMKLAVPDRQLSFYLDPDTISARIDNPHRSGSFLLLPVHISTPYCQNRMVTYVINGSNVESFDYIGDNCAAPITVDSGNRWAIRQSVSALQTSVWTFDGTKLQKKAQYKKSRKQSTTARSAAEPTKQALGHSDSQPAADQAQQATPIGSVEKAVIHIDLMN